MCSAHHHGQRKGCVGCGLPGIMLPSGFFWTGGWNVPPIVNASRNCHKKWLGSAVRQEGSLTREGILGEQWVVYTHSKEPGESLP